jgi:LPS-assembly lipoprotein
MSSAKAALAALSLLLLAGCGFHPLYAGNRGDAVEAKLADIRIDTILDRPGQMMRNDLINTMHEGIEEPVKPLYALGVSLRETKANLGLQRDASATYARLYLYASFRLTDLKTGKLVLQGQSNVNSTYGLPAGGYVTLSSEDDARERALKDLADILTTRIALYLRRGTQDKPPGPELTGAAP